MLTPAYPPFPGGGERYVHSLARNLVQRGHAVTVLTSAAQVERELWQGCGKSVTYEWDEGIEIIRCPIRGLPGGWPMLLAWRKLMVLISLLPGEQTAVLCYLARAVPSIQKLPTILNQLVGHYDLVHGFNISWEYPLITGWLWARKQHLPFALTPFAHLGVTSSDRVALNSTMDHQRRVLSDAEVVFTLTSVEQYGLEEYGVQLKRVTTVGSGLDPLPETADFAPLQQKYQLTTPFVIFIGRNSFEKGAIHAAQAVLALRQQGQTTVALVLVGQIAAEFERFYSHLSKAEKEVIRPLGLLSEQDKHTLLSQAEALLLPSRTDSFGIVLLEAWAYGKPVIGARAGGIPGVVDDGQNGLLIPFGDVPALTKAIYRLLKSLHLKQTLGQQGRAKITAEYTWAQVTDRIESHYQALILTQ